MSAAAALVDSSPHRSRASTEEDIIGFPRAATTAIWEALALGIR